MTGLCTSNPESHKFRLYSSKRTVSGAFSKLDDVPEMDTEAPPTCHSNLVCAMGSQLDASMFKGGRAKIVSFHQALVNDEEGLF